MFRTPVRGPPATAATVTAAIVAAALIGSVGRSAGADSAPRPRGSVSRTVAQLPPVTQARARAFLLMGDESPFRHLPSGGSTVATDVTRSVEDVASLPGDRIAVLTTSGRIEMIDEKGRLSPVAKLPGFGSDLDLEPSGSLLAVADGQLWRVDGNGRTTPLTAPAENVEEVGVRGVDSLPDGGFLYVKGHQVRRRFADGRDEAVAGTGASGKPRAGTALRSPLEEPRSVSAQPDGGFLFSAAGQDEGSVWQVDAGGDMRLFAGGGRALSVPPSGRPATSIRLPDVKDVLALSDGAVAVLDEGVLLHVLKDRGIHLLVPTKLDTAGTFPPLWAGAGTAHATVETTGVDRTPAGEWLMASYDGVVLVTNGGIQSTRLAASLHPDTLAAVWHRRLRVSATRPASVRIRARIRERVVRVIRGQIGAGLTTLRLHRRLPAGIVDLELRATAPDGAVASHRLRVLGTRALPIGPARRSILAVANGAGDVVAETRHCRSQRRAAVTCTVLTRTEDTTYRERATMTLKRDGWLWARMESLAGRRVVDRHTERLELL